MPTASLTRLRLRHWRFLPAFAWMTRAASRQAARAPGYLDGALLAERDLTFWTLTLWADEAALKAYRAADAHGRAMPRLAQWCDEASVVRFAADALPSFAEADRCLREAGRASRVRRPSPRHAGLAHTPPRGRALPLRRAS
jgi:heme-degrading monooxygenase HmoA